ncbi:MAG: hypothetical protein AB7T48_01650 [Solirubrobacterales bacterium]
MSVTARIAVFAVGLVAIFAGAVGIGSLVDRADTKTGAAHEEGGHAAERHSEGSPKEEEMYRDGGHRQMTPAPAGLAVSEGGYSLLLAPTFLAQNAGRDLHFSITDADGETVSDFDELHERRMHLILVRRDGRGFQHLHPEMDEAGTWTEALKLAESGVYRAFADFSVGGEQHTLASDLFVSGGSFQARPFPAPSALASTSGYDVSLEAEELVAGKPSSLSFAVTRGGTEVDDLGPYLGAKGHLVALREGDLAFLHVHPEEADGEHAHGGHPAATEEPAGNEIAFAATFPTAGHYRLYLQFKHKGAVRTVQFTVSVSR